MVGAVGGAWLLLLAACVRTAHSLADDATCDCAAQLESLRRELSTEKEAALAALRREMEGDAKRRRGDTAALAQPSAAQAGQVAGAGGAGAAGGAGTDGADGSGVSGRRGSYDSGASGGRGYCTCPTSCRKSRFNRKNQPKGKSEISNTVMVLFPTQGHLLPPTLALVTPGNILLLIPLPDSLRLTRLASIPINKPVALFHVLGHRVTVQWPHGSGHQ